MSDEPVKIHTDPANLNKGTERGRSLIKKSIKDHGWGRPVFAAADGTIIGGNNAFGESENLQAEGEVDFKKPIIVRTNGDTPIVHVREDIKDANDPKAKMLAILDNRTNELNLDMDRDRLADVIEELDIEVEEVGYTDDELAIEDSPVGGESGGEPAEPPMPDKAEARCKPGDIWEIGDRHHRLLVGDCRDLVAVTRLFGALKAHIAVTSPPYAKAREYDQSSGFTPIEPEEYCNWWDSVQAVVGHVLHPAEGSFIVNVRAGAEDGERLLYVHDLVLAMRRKWAWKFIDDLVWVRKTTPGKWPGRLRNDWENVLHFSKGTPKVRHAAVSYPTDRVPVDGGHDRDALAGHWSRSNEAEPGMAIAGNVIEVSVQQHHTNHTATFPIGLPSFLLKAFSDERQVVYDPFAGSGTTMLAADALNRRFVGCEISAKYADMVLARASVAGMSAKKVDSL